MSDFEFTSVVVSILIAFAFSEILASWGRLIKRRRHLEISWLYLGVSGVLLLLLIGHWLGLSEYRSLPNIRIWQSLLVFLPSFFAAFVAFLLAPEFGEDEPLDLSAHYFTVAPWVFPLLAAFLLSAGVSDRVVLENDILPFWSYLARSAILLIPAFSGRVWVHGGALAATAAAPLLLAATIATRAT